MDIYVEKPVRVYAQQWDGTEEGVKDLLPVLEKSNGWFVGEGIYSKHGLGQEIDKTKTRLSLLNPDPGSRGEDLRAGDWLICLKGGNIHTMNPGTFEAKFHSLSVVDSMTVREWSEEDANGG